MIKKYIFMALGFISLAIAYIGFVTPGIPFSIFLVFSAYCFAKSNKKMERWLYNHPWFGKFLTYWTQKKVFPQKGNRRALLEPKAPSGANPPGYKNFRVSSK